MTNRRHFCAAPWSGLSVDPDGFAKICCVSSHRIKFSDIELAQKSDAFRDIRLAVIDDAKQDNCITCWKQEQSNQGQQFNSHRSIYQYDDFFYDLQDADAHRLEHMDLRWSNTCNLTCVYCSPQFSSRWAELRGLRVRHRIQPVVPDHKLAELKFLQLAGGEPLLIKENLGLLDRLLDINPGVRIEVTSNLTSIRQNPIFEALTKFKNVTMIASFESVGERFEYIRQGAKWQDFSSNFETCAAKFPSLQANMILFPLSALGLPDAVRFALKSIPAQNIFIRPQTNGHGFDKLSRRVLTYIKTYLDHAQETIPDCIKSQVNNLIEPVITNQEHTNLPLYDKFDLLTGSNHRTLFKELYQ